MKIKKDSKIEFRCSKAFKAMMEEIAKAHNVKMSDILEQACTELIAKHLPPKKLKSDKTRVKKSDSLGSNEQREHDTKMRLFDAIDNMDEIPMFRSKPHVTRISDLTGITRNTVSKHLDEYLTSRKLK